MITRLFESKPQHPLADPKELRQIVAALPTDAPSRLIDEVSDWFASLEQLDGLRDDRLWQACLALDTAAQPALRKLTRDFLTVPQRRDVADRLAHTLRDEYCGRLVALYARVVAAAQRRDKIGEMLRPEAPLVIGRLLTTLGLQYKWTAFQHATPPAGFWQRLGSAYLAAVALGIDDQPAGPDVQGVAPRTLAQNYLQTVLLAASSPDSLHPAEIELADKVLAHFLPRFSMAATNLPGMLYWIDAALDQPPLRLATLPKASPGLRLISPGDLHDAVQAMIPQVQKGLLPDMLNVGLGGLYPQRQVGRVLRHVARYWAPHPPMREHQRHAVTTAIRIVQGFEACADRFDPRSATGEVGTEVWQAHNVSLGGVGVRLDRPGSDGPRVGTLLGLLPEGSDRWMIGIVRRLTQHHGGSTSAGVQTLTRDARLIEVYARTASGVLAPEPIRALVIDKVAGTGEVRLLLPGTTYDGRESLEAGQGGRQLLFTPVQCEDSTPDYDFAVYRARVAD